MTDSLKGLRKMADWYRPRIFDRDEAVGVDERPDVPSQFNRGLGEHVCRLGTLALEKALNRHETDATIRAREKDARWREKHR